MVMTNENDPMMTVAKDPDQRAPVLHCRREMKLALMSEH